MMTSVLCHVSGPLNDHDGNEILMEQSLILRLSSFMKGFMINSLTFLIINTFMFYLQHLNQMYCEKYLSVIAITVV